MRRAIVGVGSLLILAGAGCSRNRGEPAADAAPSAPKGPPIDRSCQKIEDCRSTCKMGPVNKEWYKTLGFHDCMDGCDMYPFQCFEGMCVPKRAVVNGKLDRSDTCLEMTHVPPKESME